MASSLAFISVSDYQPAGDQGAGFSALPHAKRNVDVLAPLLRERLVLGERPRVKTLHNPAGSDEMATFVAGAAAESDELLLIYYCGHGAVGSDGKLVLTHANTRRSMVDFEALDFERVRRACLSSAARLRVVILDCCYSGAAVVGQLADDALRGHVAIQGAYVVASSSATRPSHYLPDESTTAFSGRFAEALSTVPDGETRTLDEVVARVRERARADGLPEPQVVDTNQVGGLGLIRGAAGEQEPRALGGQPAGTGVPGLHEVYMDLTKEDNRVVAQRIESADSIFFTAHTGYNALVSQYQGALRRAVSTGCSLRVVVSDPEGPLMKADEVTKRLCPSINQAGEIKDVVESAARHQDHAIASGHPASNVQVRLYRGAPSMNALLVPGSLRVIPYLPLLDAAESPVWEYRFDPLQPPPLVRKYLGVLEALWADARPVDLSVYARL